MSMTHLSVEPAILYLGTPVVLISSINEDGSPNLAPMSSAFWLGWRGMLGFEAVSKTPNNIVRTGECEPPVDGPGGRDQPPLQVDRLEPRTRRQGSARLQVPCRQVRDRWPHARGVGDRCPPRVLECPIQLEAELERVNPMMTDEYDYTQHERSAECTLEGIVALEVRIKRVHVVPALMVKGQPNRIDPDR
jgi:flavin reductase (DIM6/NTAB) family NADH-FMN oxidoreductase RutF